MKKSVILCFLVLYSCSTVPKESHVKTIPEYFEYDILDDWNLGLDIIKEDMKKNNLNLLFRLFLNSKYEDIRQDLILIIKIYLKNYTPDYTQIFKLIESDNDAVLLSRLASSFNFDQKIYYAQNVFYSNSEFKEQLEEHLGRLILKYIHVVKLFNTEEKEIKMGLLNSSAFMKSENINNWLVEKLYDPDDEISSSAVFSLSRHGNAGYSLIAENLNSLSDRLVMISIDLLLYNKVDEAYAFYPELLNNKNDLIANKIIAGYKKLGKKSSKYILDSLEISHLDYKLQLLKLLEEIGDIDYLSTIFYLLEYSELQEYILDLYFNNKSYNLIQKLLITGIYEVQDKIVLYSIENGSDFLFSNTVVSNYTINYFLEKIELEEVKKYFELLGFDNNYIDDYESLLQIYNGLIFIDSIEKQNADEGFISKYFEIEQRKLIAEQELNTFYKGMENWLESGNLADLDRSLAIKETGSLGKDSLVNEKEDFIELLSQTERDIILNYENTKIQILRSYRNLTYRLKSFGHEIILNKGYIFLLE